MKRCPDVLFILDHIAKPGIKAGMMEPWKADLKELATLPNVVCKLSGVTTEADHGAWYPVGGLGALRDALERVARRSGVTIRTSCDVKRIVSRRGRVVGVELAGGETLDADLVVANVDAQHLYDELLKEPKQLRTLKKASPRSSTAT